MGNSLRIHLNDRSAAQKQTQAKTTPVNQESTALKTAERGRYVEGCIESNVGAAASVVVETTVSLFYLSRC